MFKRALVSRTLAAACGVFLVVAAWGCRDGVAPDNPAVARPAVNSASSAACPVCPVCPTSDTNPAGPRAVGPGAKGPETSTLYHLTDQYEPVKFSHKDHVGYADDCAICHHHHSEVEETPACRECHGQAFTHIGRPGLKGAYHRQCMGCHRDGDAGPLGCEDCHARRKTAAPSPQTEPIGVSEVVTLGHVARETSPVTFNHELHTHMADRCSDCHHHQGEVEKTPPCRECHNQRKSVAGERKLGLMDAYHKQCLGCHKNMGGPEACSTCHVPAKTNGTAKPGEPPSKAKAKPNGQSE